MTIFLTPIQLLISSTSVLVTDFLCQWPHKSPLVYEFTFVFRFFWEVNENKIKSFVVKGGSYHCTKIIWLYLYQTNQINPTYFTIFVTWSQNDGLSCYIENVIKDLIRYCIINCKSIGSPDGRDRKSKVRKKYKFLYCAKCRQIHQLLTFKYVVNDDYCGLSSLQKVKINVPFCLWSYILLFMYMGNSNVKI